MYTDFTRKHSKITKSKDMTTLFFDKDKIAMSASFGVVGLQ